jgi:CRISPR-associated protein Cmr2
MTTYFALTIGPIYETISSSRTTREMWASSYLFSYTIRQLVDEFENNKMEILLPSPAYVTHKNYHGAGIYPDRIIAKSTLSRKEVQDIIDEIIQKLAKDILNHFDKRNDAITHSFILRSNANKQDGVIDYLNKYLRIYYLCKDLDEKTDNIIRTIYPCLDSLELQPRILPSEDFPVTTYERIKRVAPSKSGIKSSPLRLFTDLVNNSFLIDDGLGTALERATMQLDPKRHFSTINEIATAELKQIRESDYAKFETVVKAEINETWQEVIERERQRDKNGIIELDSMDLLKDLFADEYKTYHNYIAIIHGDGDNVGKIIKSMTNVKDQNGQFIEQETALKAFSKMLTGYAVEATELVADYGATPVYIGGDDLFFFAPVASKNKSLNQWMTIFDLISKLDELFNSLIRDQTIYDWGLAPDEKPSLSFGISITYRKFPLYEARNISYSLMKTAKDDLGRNAVAVSILKASGHEIPLGFSKKDISIFDKIRELIRIRVDSKENFINSITFKLESQKKVLVPVSGDAERVKNFFQNNFNENYKANVSFYESLEEFIVMLACQDSPAIMNDENYKLLYGVLRFIHFLRSNEKE